MRFLGLLRADADAKAGTPPGPGLLARMGTFIEEITRAGVLIDTAGLRPSATGKPVRLRDGKVTVTDGPFTESKELIASYAVFDVRTMDEAVAWTTRFLQVLGTGECEIRAIYEPGDFAAGPTT
jgi:hypothetical protein